jgi:hypothetical protein
MHGQLRLQFGLGDKHRIWAVRGRVFVLEVDGGKGEKDTGLREWVRGGQRWPMGTSSVEALRRMGGETR